MDTSLLTNLERMFSYSYLSSINFESLNTSNVLNMKSMFEGCEQLTSVDLSKNDLSNVNTMESMFRNCAELKSINFPYFTKSSLLSMISMFSYCYNLESVDLSNFNISSVNNLKEMFYECPSLLSVNMNNFGTAMVTNMNSMFYGCNSIENIDLSSNDLSKVTDMTSAFYGCTNLKSINFPNITTSSILNMDSMFENCNSLESLDLSNVDLSNVLGMSNLFFNCEMLKSIKFTNIQTLSLYYMDSMFQNCHELEIIDLSMFNTNNIRSMNNIFSDCNSLKILDISNFKLIHLTNMEDMFSGILNIDFINLKNTQDNGFISGSYINTGYTKNFYVCQSENIINNLNSIECCDYDINENKCIQDLETTYIIQTTDKIEPNFPINNTSNIDNNNDGITNSNDININSDNTNDININNIDNFDIVIYHDNTSIIKNLNNFNITDVIEYIYNYIKDGMDEFSYSMAETENVLFQYSKYEEQILDKNTKNISSIDLGDCEYKLREQEGLNDSESFNIIKFDLKNPDKNAIFVQYEIYNPHNNHKESLEICKNLSMLINIFTPFNSEKEKIELIKSFEGYDYNIFDINDKFYHDICATYTDKNGVDMALSMRKNRIYDSIKDIYLCQEGCEFKGFDTETNKAICNCKIQDNFITDINKISFDKNEFQDSFYKTLYNSNFRVLKCIKLLFTIEGIETNCGFYVMTAFFGSYISLIIIHILKGQRKIFHILHTIKKSKELNQNDEEKNNKKIKDIKKRHSTKRHTKRKSRKLDDVHAPRKKSKYIINSNENEKVDKRIYKNTTDNILNTKDKMNKETIDVEKEEKNDNKINEEKIKKENKYLTSDELNDLDYELAIILDKRTYCQYYYSLLKKDQLIIFTFIADDYNLRQIKIILFIISFSLFFTINAFFFTDDTMDKI